MSSALQGMGIASINPSYEDGKSPRLNALALFILGFGLPFVLLDVAIEVVTPIINTYLTGVIALLLGIVISVIIPFISLGLLLFYVGMKNLMRTSR